VTAPPSASARHLAGSDPRWPGPPSTWPGEPGAPDGRSTGAPDGRGTGGPTGSQPPPPTGPAGPDPDGPPPPPWQRRRRAWLVGLAIAGAALVMLIPVGFGIAALTRAASEISLTEDDGVAADDPDEGEAGPPSDVEVVPPDLDDLDGVDEAIARMLVDIDRSEQVMMDTQQAIAEVLASPDTGGDLDAAVEEVSAAAGEGQRELQEIREELTAPVEGSEEGRAVRDRYLAHLDAWVRYLVAVEDDPALLAGGGEEEPYLVAIDTTGDAFAREVRDGLPEDLDDEVREYALAIVERGFPDREPDEGDTV
jgi:hypothetical protein